MSANPNSSVELTLMVKGADVGASDTFAKLGKNMKQTFAEGLLDAKKFESGYQQVIDRISQETLAKPRFVPQAYVPPPQITIEPHPSQIAQAEAEKARATARANLSNQTVARFRPESDEDEGGFRSAFDSVNQSLGRRSFASKFLHLVGSGGAVGLVASEIKGAAEHMAELNKQIEEGDRSWQGIAIGVGKSLPIFGRVVEAGQAIREALTGERLEIDRVNESAKAGTEHAEFMLRSVREQRKEWVEIGRSVRDAYQEAARAGLAGPAATIARINTGQQNRAADIPEQMQDALRAADDKFAKQFADANKRASDLAARLQPDEGQRIARIGFNNRGSVGVAETIHHKEYDEYHAIQDQITQLSEQKEAEREQIRQKFAEQEKAARAKDAAELREIERESQRQMDEIAREGYLKTAQDQAEVEAQKLRLQSRGFEGEQLLLRANLERQTETIAHNAELAKEKITLEFPASRDRAGLLSGIDDDAKAQTHAAAQRAAIAAEQQRRQQVLNIAEQSADVRHQEMQDLSMQVALGDKAAKLAYDELQRLDEKARRQQEITRLLQGENLTIENRTKLLAEQSALDARTDAARQGANATTTRDAARQAIEGSGISIAEKALKQFDIKEKYRGLRERLAAVGGPDSAKALSLLPTLEQRELGLAARQGIEPVGTAGVQSNRFGRLHGFGLAAREDAAHRQHDVGPELLKTLQEMLGVMKHQDDVIHQSAGQQAPLF
ncbi:MAG TPA: hypothetical protein VH370_20520 [Humisphaera sp.]|jgi:hypothetical protein|nr:hypothetical protein [Humisphaera sp.]